MHAYIDKCDVMWKTMRWTMQFCIFIREADEDIRAEF